MLGIKYWLAVLALVAACGVMPARAQELGPTLQRIKDTGVVLVGFRDAALPFTFADGNGQMTGYGMEYVWKIIEAVKQELKVASLEVKFVPLSPQNRIPLMLRGMYDLECATTTNNRERQRQVAFSNTFFIGSIRMLVDKGSDVKDLADLHGANVVVTAGTTSENVLHELNDRQGLGMRIISTKSYSDALKTVETGRAEAFFLDDILLAGEIALSPNPDNWAIVGSPLSYEAYGCVLKRGDTQFKALVDKAIAEAQLSGEAEGWFKYWFQKPVLPGGINLRFAISNSMKELFKNPNDNPF